MDLNSVLQSAQNPDRAIRSEAEQLLEDALSNQYGPFLVALVEELVNEENPPGNRQLAGLYLKNIITAQDEAILQEKEGRWHNCDIESKEAVREGLLQALISPVREASHTSAQVIAAFGAVDVQAKEWTNLLPTLLQFFSNDDAPELAKVSSLEALGYLCDAMDPDLVDGVDKTTVDMILTCIVGGMSDNCTNDIRAAAVTAMANSLKFCSKNFEVEEERDTIMQAVCDSAQCNDARVRMKAFQCMDEVAENFYEYLPAYVEAMFSLSIEAMTNDEEEVGKQAVEFWSTVCDQEQEIIELLEENPDAAVTRHDIIPQAAGTLMPVILNLLLHQPEDPEEENYSIQNNASVLLVYMSEVLRDAVLDHVIPFISSNIVSSEWRNKEAALTAFGSILEGPSSEKCLPIIQAAVQMLIECFQFPHPTVRASAAFALGRVCEFHSTAIPPEHLPDLLAALISSLEDPSSKVAVQGCYSLYQLTVACEEYRDDATNILSEYFQNICMQLLNVTTREDWDVDNLRVSAYETLMAVVDNSAQDMSETVLELLNDALNRLENTFASREDIEEKMQLQSCLCGLISSCIQKLSKDEINSCSDRIITLTLQVFTTKGALAHEDAFNMVGKFAEKVGTDFNRYMAHFAPCLVTGLQNMEEYQVCTTAVCAVGDLSRAMTGHDLLPYCDVIMESLLSLLQAQHLDRSVKPPILSSFSDIAMCIGGEFEQYATVVLNMLEQAGTVTADSHDEDLVEYVNSLRESILEAYTGILHGLGDGEKLDVLMPHLEALLAFMELCSTDENKTIEVVKNCIALLGDLGQFFGNKMNGIYEQQYINQLVQEGMQNPELNEITSWTCGVIETCRKS